VGGRHEGGGGRGVEVAGRVIMPGRLTSLVRLVCGCVHNRCGKGVGGLREGEGKGGKSSGVESGT
jgi:hypothetical protein